MAFRASAGSLIDIDFSGFWQAEFERVAARERTVRFMPLVHEHGNKSEV